MNLQVVDLFAGVGGLSLGFKAAGFQPIIANEIDSEIATSYKYNHPGTTVLVDDIVALNKSTLFDDLAGRVDVIIGGPPCQGFSQKGQRRSILDPRNFLFREFVRTVEIVRPSYFVMENVPNLLTSENGYFKEELNDLFSRLGYYVSSAVVNAYDFGVPQNRRRAIVLGTFEHELNIHNLASETSTRVNVWDAISDLNFLNSGEGQDGSNYPMPPKSAYQRLLRLGSARLYNHVATRHSRLALERLAYIPANCDQKVLPKEHQTKSIYAGTWTRLHMSKPAPTITTRFDTPSSGQFTHPFLNRAVTVREAARLQSFPDTFRFYGTKGSQMKQVGNAVPPKLAESLAKLLKADIEVNRVTRRVG